jgi:hypothetical protein
MITKTFSFGSPGICVFAVVILVRGGSMKKNGGLPRKFLLTFLVYVDRIRFKDFGVIIKNENRANQD